MNNLEAFKKGVFFLKRRQLSSGEFPTMVSQKPEMKNPSYIKSPFFTALILHSIRHCNKLEEISNITQKAINFLIQERDDTGYWRFFGKGSNIPPDLDDTCCALSALYLYGTKLDYETIANSLLRYRNSEGIFNTWILNSCQASKKNNYANYVDWVVNVNILFFYSLIKKPFPEIENYLCRIIRGKIFTNGSKYYNSPYSFIYFFTRLYADRQIKKFYLIIPVIKEYLLDTQNTNGGWGNSLEDAMSTISLIKTGFNGLELEKAINNLICFQENDGGWPISPFSFYKYPNEIFFYGSRELNTAIALDALWEYKEKDESGY